MSGNGNIDDIAQMCFEDARRTGVDCSSAGGGGRQPRRGDCRLRARGCLQRHCDAKLQEAQSRVDRIVLGRNGAVSSELISLE